MEAAHPTFLQRLKDEFDLTVPRASLRDLNEYIVNLGGFYGRAGSVPQKQETAALLLWARRTCPPVPDDADADQALGGAPLPPRVYDVSRWSALLRADPRRLVDVAKGEIGRAHV